jgi:hypothetical protein
VVIYPKKNFRLGSKAIFIVKKASSAQNPWVNLSARSSSPSITQAGKSTFTRLVFVFGRRAFDRSIWSLISSSASNFSSKSFVFIALHLNLFYRDVLKSLVSHKQYVTNDILHCTKECYIFGQTNGQTTR